MAKVIQYQFLSCEINRGTEENPYMEQVFLDKKMPYSEANEEIAQKEAHNSEYTIEDDGQPEPEVPETDTAVWAELDAAYQEGVDSV